MKPILKTIQAKLSEIPELKYIDENWGQLDYYNSNIPVQWPCCLIDIQSADYSDIGRDNTKIPVNRQMGNVSVKITIANLKLTNTGLKASEAQKNEAWKIWDSVEQVHQKLHGFNPDVTCSKMMRQNMQRTLRDDGVQEYQLTYTFEAHDI